MNPGDFEFISSLLKSRSGLVLTIDKSYLLESRLMPVARKHGLKGLDELVAAVGQVGHARLLVMATLLVADELSDAYAELEGLKAAGADATERLAAEESLGGTMETLARRIADVAQTLEQSDHAA